jgi:hypothetical protein
MRAIFPDFACARWSSSGGAIRRAADWPAGTRLAATGGQNPSTATTHALAEPYLKEGVDMADPSDKLAESLEILKSLQDAGVVAVRAGALSRTHPLYGRVRFLLQRPPLGGSKAVSRPGCLTRVINKSNL